MNSSFRHGMTWNIAWAAAEAWGAQLSGFAVTLVLARLLGPGAYGLAAMALAVNALGHLLVTAGWSEALIQRKELEREHIDTVFWFCLALSVCLALGISLVAPVAANLLGEPNLVDLVRWLSVGLPLSAVSAVLNALLRRELRFRPLALRSLLATAGGGAVGIVMALAGSGVWALIGLNLSQRLLDAIVLWSLHPWRPRLRTSARHLREIGVPALILLGSRALYLVEETVPRLLIGSFLGPVILAYYALAGRILAAMAEALIYPLTKVSMPTFALLQGDTTQVRGLLLFGVQGAAMIAFAAYLGIATVAPDLIPLVLGGKWTASVPALQILALGGLALPLRCFYDALLQGLGRTGWHLAVNLVGTGLLCVLMLVASQIGLVAVALAGLAWGYLMLPIRLRIMGRLTGSRLTDLLYCQAPGLAAGCTMSVVILFWRAMLAPLPSVFSLVSSVCIGGLVYLLLILLFARTPARRMADFIRAFRSPAS